MKTKREAQVANVGQKTGKKHCEETLAEFAAVAIKRGLLKQRE